MKNLIIAGGGGFGAEVAWVAEDLNAQRISGGAEAEWNILGYVDDDLAKAGREFYGYHVLGTLEEFAQRLGDQEIWYHCAIGDNAAREQMVGRLSAFGWSAATLVHPSVVRARTASVAEGAYVAPLSVLSPNCKIGRHVIVNQRVAIGHDVIIDDFCNICPGAQLNGFCRIGRLSLVGSNASIHQGRTVGESATVAANSMVIRNVASGTLVIGIPARKIAA